VQVFELEVGEAVQIGDKIVTVVDINDLEVSLRMDPLDPLPIGFDESGFECDTTGS
jgi:hypothetical protein